MKGDDFDCSSSTQQISPKKIMSDALKPPKSRVGTPRAVAAVKNSPVEKIGVLIADDHSTLAGLTSIIDMEDDMFVVAQATDGRQAVTLWQKHRPSVALLDLRMPILDGVGVIDEIRQEDPSARIVILTTYDSDNDIYRAIKAGAKGYLLKDARREQLLDCIRKVNGGVPAYPRR